ncbi:hypothetical protein COY07_03115 [Candidatus Peregrinibacteria bacterium CG_4_10_14_0_2_um_filter_43_11]|nr:MAG: hypothetical protein COY07_03115 [Candidatus Peregrinibacteria bacterium CG_4_10_14_0_2_um_filter_43_11]
MEISTVQLTNPGVYEFTDERGKRLRHYNEAVRRAQFLDEDQKKKWQMLGYLLDTGQLAEAERVIISEDLARLKTRQKLNAIKPKFEQRK